jgi:hypothetical protein
MKKYALWRKTMKQIDSREGARRQHRTIALFCVIQCWMRGLEGLILERQDLERLLGLERFKGTRIDWLREDFKEFFPYQSVEESPYEDSKGYTNKKQQTFKSLSIVRSKEIKPEQVARLHLWQRPSLPGEDDWTTQLHLGCFIPLLEGEANYDERVLVAYLSLLMQGQISPKSIPLFDPNPSDDWLVEEDMDQQ